MNVARELRQQGWSDEAIARARVNGKPIGEITEKPHKLSGYRNDWEALYAMELEYAKRTGEIVDWRYEGIRLKLADGAHYTPDFFVVLSPTEFDCIEIKGYKREAAIVRFKVARDLYRWWKFRMLTRTKSGWEEINL